MPSLNNVQTPSIVNAENLGNSLEGNQVNILTSTRTASASELIINGLRPSMDVFIMGDQTTGKNVGSIALDDEDNEENTYGILPIVSQSFNSLDQSDYTTGFTPDILVKESQERLLPLGDVNEFPLRTAISPNHRYSFRCKIPTSQPSGCRKYIGHKVQNLELWWRIRF